MPRPTKEQLRALQRVYDRCPITDGGRAMRQNEGYYGLAIPLTYRQFRRTAQYIHHMGVLMVPWCGMYLGIEPDGHTHS